VGIAKMEEKGIIGLLHGIGTNSKECYIDRDVGTGLLSPRQSGGK